MPNSRTAERLVQPLFYSVPEVCELLGGISRKTVYRLLDRGKLRASPALRHKLITRDSLLAFANLASTSEGVTLNHN
jgi:excisionase family DNA binding protein